MVVVVALLFFAGWHNLRARRVAMQQAQQATVTVTKSDGVDDGSPVQNSLRGKMAPGFSLVDTTGKKVSLADYKGRPVVVNFWATWCGPCKLEMPWFEEFHTKYKSQGLEVLGISEDEGLPKEDIVKSANKAGVTYPILLTDGKVAKAYGGVDFLPETFYVDKNGTVVVDTAGAPSKDEMEANIKKTIGGM
jgi:peroxiredoxin